MTTQDLKTLMDQATDRSTPFVPDLDQLLAGGRRRTRTHFAVTMVSTIAVVGAAATAALFVLDPGGGTAPSVLPVLPPAGQASQPIGPKMVTTCVWGADRGGFKAGPVDGPVILAVKDKYGSSSVRHSKKQFGLCSELAVGTPGVIREPHILGKPWKPGLPKPPGTVWLMTPRNQKTYPSGPEIVTVFAGQLPAKAVRVIVTPSSGKPVEATVRDDHFLYRGIGRLDPARPATATTYDAAGRKLETYVL
jgi:hypothetical protein